MLITSRPFSVGSIFTSRSRLRSNVLAVAISRSRSSRVTSPIEIKCRRGGGGDGRVAGALLDQAAEPLRERNAAGLDPDECDARQVRVALDDLVRDAGQRP